MEVVMRKSKKYSEWSTDSRKRDGETDQQSVLRPRANARRVHVPKRSCKDQFSIIEPQINADGVHVWPFDVSCPVDVLFLTEDGRHNVRMNRHGYFEVLYFCAGSADCHIQDRLLPVREGDLAIIGSTIYHRVECRSSTPLTIAALFFEPDLIRCDGGSDSAEYLTPFLLQDPGFPHVVPAETGIPNRVLELMLLIRSELPPLSPRGRLAIKTYLKMILILLVNRYASYAGTVETFQRQQRALDTLLPLFRYLSEQHGTAIQVREAARICGMSESYFMSFFKRVTGLSFIKYLNHYRVECSQALLANTDESMASISQEMGFCDQSYYGAVFHRLVGMTPAAYRRRFRNKNASDRRQLDHTLPITARRISLTGTQRPSTAEINRQLASFHSEPYIDRFGT
jgi:AraC-like DNA-binding protein/mannose-6-phosphate isomerase-like protein (cupin superfamily)